jgi:hypothetical protein
MNELEHLAADRLARRSPCHRAGLEALVVKTARAIAAAALE